MAQDGKQYFRSEASRCDWGGFAVVENRWRRMCSRNEKLPLMSDGQAERADLA